MSNVDHFLWSKPRHHEDLDNKSHHVGWIELFYDLVHVVCVFLLGDYLTEHMGLGGFFVFLGLFAMIWMAWGDTVFYTSMYVSTDITQRLLMALQVCAIMVFAAALPTVDGAGAPYFAVAYGVNRGILAIMYWRSVKHGNHDRSMAWEMARAYTLIAVLFILSALLPSPWIYIAWGGIIVFINVSYVHPTRGFMRHQRFIPRIEHLSERFALLMLIVLGEGFFKMVVTLADKGIDKVAPDIFVNYILGGFALFSLGWAYFDFVGNGRIQASQKHMNLWWFSHLGIMLSAIMIGVALKGEVQVGLMETFPLKYAILGALGLVIFLTCLWLIQHSIEEKDNHELYGFGLRLFGIITALFTLAISQLVPSVVGNTLYMTALCSQIAVPFWRSHRLRQQKLAAMNEG